jgi:nicotinamidase-related amidase
VCIQQTALELIGRGIEVHIVADATSSRSMMDRMFALEVIVLLENKSLIKLKIKKK